MSLNLLQKIVTAPRIPALVLPLLLIGLSLGCGGTSNDPAPPATRDLTGTYQQLSWRPDGTSLTTPGNLDVWNIEAIVDNNGIFKTYPGDGAIQGTYTIKGVPADGHYWNRQNITYLWTDQTVVDWNVDAGERRQNYSTVAAGHIVFNGTGLAPVVSGDCFGFWCPNLGFSYGSRIPSTTWENFFASSWTKNIPAVGATTLVGTDVDWYTWPIISAAAGDAVTMVQSRKTTLASGLQYWSIIKSASLPLFNLNDGDTVAVSEIAFSDPPASTLGFHFSRTKWEDQKNLVAPVPGQPATVKTRVAGIFSIPGGLAKGRYKLTYEFPVLSVAAWPTDDTVDIAEPSLPLRTTLDPSTFVYAYDWTYNKLMTSTMSVTTRSKVELSSAPGPANPVAPMPPVTGVKLDGILIPNDGTGSFSNPIPVVSWTSPAGYTPTSYEITIFNASTGTTTGRVKVPGDVTSCRIPRDILFTGKNYKYFFFVTADSVSGLNLRKTPNKLGLPRYYTEMNTALFTLP